MRARLWMHGDMSQQQLHTENECNGKAETHINIHQVRSECYPVVESDCVDLGTNVSLESSHEIYECCGYLELKMVETL